MSQHIVPIRTYLFIFFSLLILTAITIWVAFQDLGIFNDVVALGIATTKACLVIFFFMHLKYSHKLNWAYVFSAFLFLTILLVITLSDYWTRGWYVATEAW